MKLLQEREQWMGAEGNCELREQQENPTQPASSSSQWTGWWSSSWWQDPSKKWDWSSWSWTESLSNTNTAPGMLCTRSTWPRSSPHFPVTLVICLAAVSFISSFLHVCTPAVQVSALRNLAHSFLDFLELPASSFTVRVKGSSNQLSRLNVSLASLE